MACNLYSHQEEALAKMKNGCILHGGVGSGKSRTGVAYYYTLHGGLVSTKSYVKMKNPCDLYIITTAQKRDKHEWDGELKDFFLSPDPKLNMYKNKVIVDSWNNIQKYAEVSNAFFIFDEQRAIGDGEWAKTFIKIARKNKWIMLSATPGDVWKDYMPVFVANGFYKNKTDFYNRHVVWSRFTNFPSIQRYINEGRLLRLKHDIQIDMDFDRKTRPHHEWPFVNYDSETYSFIEKKRWNVFTDKPIKTPAEHCFTLRRLVNSHISRCTEILNILEEHPKAIIFYSYDYELDILRLLLKDYPHAEWNGHKHEPLPVGDKWVYLVEYVAGCEGWNCITTDTIIFYSLNYSYKVTQQASGRIDRLNTPFIDLYYYHLKSNSKIDNAIFMALKKKKKFNEKTYYESVYPKEMDSFGIHEQIDEVKGAA